MSYATLEGRGEARYRDSKTFPRSQSILPQNQRKASSRRESDQASSTPEMDSYEKKVRWNEVSAFDEEVVTEDANASAGEDEGKVCLAAVCTG